MEQDNRSAKRFCGSCGNQIPFGVQFCTICGAKQVSLESVEPKVEDASKIKKSFFRPANEQSDSERYDSSTDRRSSTFESPQPERFAPSVNRNTATYEHPQPERTASFAGRSASINATRDEALDELGKMYQWFSQKKQEYDEVDALDKKLTVLNQPKAKALLTLGIIFAAVLVVVFCVFQALPILIAALVIGGGMIGGYVLLNVKRKNDIKAVNARIMELEQILDAHYQQYGRCILTKEYVYPDYIELLYQCIEQGRADTIKEAMNIVLNDSRMNEMAEMQRQTMVNTQRAARAATASAVIGGVNLARGFRKG